jgi:hypothetical protein
MAHVLLDLGSLGLDAPDQVLDAVCGSRCGYLRIAKNVA